MAKYKIIEELAQQRTENAEVSELKSAYLNSQRDNLEWWTEEDLIEIYQKEVNEKFTTEDLTDE